MTVLQKVSAREMERQTGFKKALGYSFPKEDKILIRKGLSKKVEKEVKQHEEEHMVKGEEGPLLGLLIGAAATLFGARSSSKAAKKATAASTQAASEQIAFARESRDLARQDYAPYREAGTTALDALMSMTGLKGTGGSRREGRPLMDRRADGADRDVLGTWGGAGFRGSAYANNPAIRPRYGGGNIYGREHGGDLFNINELGPESVYQNGSYTRSNLPATIPPNPTGYVAPNITGRAHGGRLTGSSTIRGRQTGGDLVGWGGPQDIDAGGFNLGGKDNPSNPTYVPPTGGTTIDNTTGQVFAGGQGPNDLTNPNHPDYQGPPSGLNTSLPLDPGYTPPQENPGGVEGGYNFMTDPGYQFRFQEGQRALERGASARGGLLSGGFARKMTRYGQDIASAEYGNVYNRISNIAGLGQVATGRSGQAALYGGAQMGAAAGQAGYARASGYTAQGNIWAGAAGQIAQLPWGDMFNRSTPTLSGTQSTPAMER